MSDKCEFEGIYHGPCPKCQFTARVKEASSLAPVSLLAGRRKRCNCWLCKRTRKFYTITAKLPDKERDWMRAFYNATMDMECEFEMAQAS